MQPPAGLDHDPDRGIYAVLAVPWGEEIEPPHRDAGHVFDRGEVHLPDLSEDPPVNMDHHADSVVGVIVGAATDDRGLWCSVKMGRRGRSLLLAGFRAVSPEIAEDGRLIGLALATVAPSGLPSARVLVPQSQAPAPAMAASRAIVGPSALDVGKAPVGPAEWEGPAWGSVGFSSTIGTGAKAAVVSGQWTPPASAGPPNPEDPELVAARARLLFEQARRDREAEQKALQDWHAAARASRERVAAKARAERMVADLGLGDFRRSES